jgi:DNA-binding GntR family transcriptional regulator
MPELPTQISNGSIQGVLPSPTPAGEPADSPYLRIAADLRAAIRCGAIRDEDPLPQLKDLARRYGVAVATAHRAVSLLVEDGEVVASRGRRTVVRATEAENSTTAV